MFARILNTENKKPRVLTYINSRLARLCFSLRKDILNHKNINLVSFFNHSFIYIFINIYSDNQKSTLKYLKNTEVNLNNILIMTGNFNIRDNNWDSLYLHYSTHTDTLKELANSFSLELSMLVNQVPNYYIDNIQDTNFDTRFNVPLS